MLKGVKLE